MIYLFSILFKLTLNSLIIFKKHFLILLNHTGFLDIVIKQNKNVYIKIFDIDHQDI